MYANPVCKYHPRKENPHWVRLAIDDDIIPYPSDSGDLDATLLEAKIIFNSVFLTPGYELICADIKGYFLSSPVERFKYTKIPLC